MYKLLFITFIATILSAHNPLPYAALGNIIYDNAEKIQQLTDIDAYNVYKDDIEQYLKDLKVTKVLGYKLEKESASSLKKKYLNSLRRLSKKNDYYLRSINTQYNEAMKSKNYKLFLQIINKKLINIKKHKKEIIDYYYTNQENIDKSGVIDELLKEDARLKALKESQKRRYKTKKELEAEKIKRIRENDKLARQKLEAELQKDLINKKEKIREIQKRELAH